MIELKKCLIGAGINGYPGDYLTHWQGLGNHSSGYTSSIYEWDNKIDSRDFIERILYFDSLNVFDEFQTFKDIVQQADEAVRSSVLLDILPVEGPWWHRCLPKKAGYDFIKQVASRYGPEIASYIIPVQDY